MTTPAPIREPGLIIGGRYVLGETLGSGGMGVVHLARHLGLDRRVAIKFLHHVLARDPQTVERFKGEAHAAALLDHPNAVTVLEYGEDQDGAPFLVMEYVDGRTLREVAAGEPIGTERAVSICLQVLAALDQAHALAIVHADVKTENILIEPRPDGERARLVDFGLALVGRAPSDDDDVVDDALLYVAGTPEYMAPEVILGARPSPAADLYGVGVILHELITGVPPFAGGPSTDIIARQVFDDVVPPSIRFPERQIPRALEDVIIRALDKEPERRYSSATAFIDALGALRLTGLVHAPAVPCHVSRPESTTKAIRRPNGRAA